MFGDWNNHFPKEINHLHFPLFFVRKKKQIQRIQLSQVFSVMQKVSHQRGLEKEWTCTRIPWWIRHRRFGGSWTFGRKIVSVPKNPWEFWIFDDFQRCGSWVDSPQHVRFGSSEASSIFHGLRFVEEMFGFWYVFERWDYYGAYNFKYSKR